MPEPHDPQPRDTQGAPAPGPGGAAPTPGDTEAASGDADRAMEQALAGAKASLSEIEAELADAEAAAGGGQAGAGGDEADPGIELLGDVDLDVTIQLGRTEMLLEDVLRLGEGSVVELDKLAGDPVDVFVNGRLVARGEVLVLNDNFCIRISEIVANLEEQAAAAAQEQEQAAAAAAN